MPFGMLIGRAEGRSVWRDVQTVAFGANADLAVEPVDVGEEA